MRKIISLIHLSLDGFSAGPNDEMDWIYYDEEIEKASHAMHAVTDAVIWGRKTYELMAGYWLTVPDNPNSTAPEREHAQWLQDATKIVVSRTMDKVAWGGAQNTVLIKEDIAEQINAIKQQPGKDIWFLGSTTLAQTFTELSLIDEYRINVNPVVLGEGKPFFDNISHKVTLKLLEAHPFQNGVVMLRYEPERK